MTNKQIGKNLKKARIKNNYSITDVSNKLENYNYPCCNKTIYKWEDGSVSPDINTLLILCYIYHTTLSNILELKEQNVKTLSEEEYLFIDSLRKSENYKKVISSIIKKGGIINNEKN